MEDKENDSLEDSRTVYIQSWIILMKQMNRRQVLAESIKIG